MDNTTTYKNHKKLESNCKSPILFTIPLDIYSEEVCRERDKESFLKIQKLQKKCEELRQNFHAYSQLHSLRLEATKFLVLRTMAVRNIRRNKNINDESKYIMH